MCLCLVLPTLPNKTEPHGQNLQLSGPQSICESDQQDAHIFSN